jgi:hypothetical protein
MVKAAVNSRVQQTDPAAPPVDSETVRREASKSNGVIPMGWQMVRTNDYSEFANIVQMSQTELERMGPTPAVLGRNLGSDTSGRSRLVQQQAGLTESSPHIGRISNWMERIYQTYWFIMREYWPEQMYVQVSGNAKAPEWLVINDPIVEMRSMPVMGPDGQPQINEQTGAPLMRPQSVTVGYNNDLAAMDMNIAISSVPHNPTLEYETWQETMKLLQSGIPVGSPEFLIALEMAPIPDKTNVQAIIEKHVAQQQESQAQQAQQAAQQAQIGMQLQAQQSQAKTANLTASAQKHTAEAQRTALEADQMARAGNLQQLLQAAGIQPLQ